MSASENQRLAADLARRAVAAADRRRALEAAGTDAAERLRAVADDDGRLSVEEALGALSRPNPQPVNPFAAELQRAADKQAAAAERLFGKPEPEEPRAFGDVGAGLGSDGSERFDREWIRPPEGPPELRRVIDPEALKRQGIKERNKDT
jgi:hypothetical protein